MKTIANTDICACRPAHTTKVNGLTPVPATAAEIDRLQAAESAIDRELELAKESLRQQRIALVEARRPFNEMVQEWRNQRERYDSSAPLLTALQERADGFQAWLDATINADGAVGTGNRVSAILNCALQAHAAGAMAAQILPIFANLLTTRKNILADLESRLVAYAKANGLTDDLPQDLQVSAAEHATSP
jgi:hypothetical protein